MIEQTTKTPWHLWVVGILTLIFNAGGVIDYTMSQLRNRAYLEMSGADYDVMVGWIESFPFWAHGFWALGTWGAFIGSLLLLFRSRHAVTAFLVSIVGLIGTSIAQFLFVETPAELQGPGMIVFSVVIVVVTVGLYFYSRAMAKRGVLR